MVTYEVTATVREELASAYERYMRERHIPDLLATGAFVAASLSQASPGRYRIRYEAPDRATLDRDLAEHAPRLREDFARRFPEGVELPRARGRGGPRRLATEHAGRGPMTRRRRAAGEPMRRPLAPGAPALILLAALACAEPPAADRGEEQMAAATPALAAARPPAPEQSVVSSTGELLESRVPRAVAGEPRWRYQQRASADLDGDGAPETAVLIADVELDPQGQPLWDDGHRWQVYVEEADGTRTYVYARFLPNGKLTADLARPDSGAAPTIVLLEQTPYTLRVYDVAYRGPQRAAVVARFGRDFAPGDRFTGSPRP